MKKISLTNPAPDERIAAISPELSSEVEAGWRKRLRYYTRRALSDTALQGEQASRAGHIALRGQMVSPGIVTGLEVGLEKEGFGDEARYFLHIMAGFGVLASGEDAIVAQPRRIAIDDVVVHGLEAPVDGDEPLAKRLEPTLGLLRERNVTLPRALVLVLQAVEIRLALDLDPTDPCAIDEQSDAFNDWQRIDASRLMFVPWSGLPLPAPDLPGAVPDPQWRNRLAYTIFTAEGSQQAGELLVWEAVGLPLGLVGMSADMRPIFVDGYAVRRDGGKPKRRTALLPKMGNPFLWQARMRQLGEQLAEEVALGSAVDQMAGRFRYLPPAGLLPVDAVTARESGNRFFPSSYHVEAIPIPVEQLDVAIEASASLEPFDMQHPDHVQVLVPVPQQYYEPNLLQVEHIDLVFQQEINRFVRQRGEWLARRVDVRAKAAILSEAITGEALKFQKMDPDALDRNEWVQTAELYPVEELFGTVINEDNQRQVTAIVDLLAFLNNETPLGDEEVAKLSEDGLSRFIQELQNKANRAEDRIDFGFLRVHAEIYRLQEALRGNESATRLATSPTLAKLVKEGVSAVSTREDLERFFYKAKGGTIDGPDMADPIAIEPSFIPGVSPFLTPSSASLVVNLTNDESTSTLASSILGSGTERGFDTIRGTTPPIIVGRGTVGGTRPPIIIESGTIGGARPPIIVDRGTVGGTRPPIIIDSGTIGGTRPPIIVDPGTIDFPTAPSPGSIFTIPGVGDVFFPPSRGVDVAVSTIPTERDITQSQPIVGKPLNFRTVTIADRLEEPISTEAKVFTVAAKYEVYKELAGLDLNLDNLEVPGFYAYEGDTLEFDNVTAGGKVKQIPRERKHTFADIIENARFNEILVDRHDMDPTDGDEAAFFSAGVRALDHTVATLRVVEGRVQSYKRVLARCQETLQDLLTLQRRASVRLSVIENELAETRHDISLARALLAEEEARINGINQRRDMIMADYVSFLAFVRPRLATTRHTSPMPVRHLAPVATEQALPACFAQPLSVPLELRQMINLFREAPLRWLPPVNPILERLGRISELQSALLLSQQRAEVQTSESPVFRATTMQEPFSRALENTLAVQQQTLVTARQKTARINTSAIPTSSWKSLYDAAQWTVSLGDVIASGAARTDVVQNATGVLDSMAHVATCLYERIGTVPAAVRLVWAQAYSQFDQPINLRSLAILPRWAEIDLLQRQAMQSLVDWLYQQIDTTQAEPVSMMHDLVRVCILLASHAPVSQIIAGHIVKPVPVLPGGSVLVNVDVRKVWAGMPALLYKGNEVVAQARVDDFSVDTAALTIIKALKENVMLEMNDKVHFGDKRAITSNPLTRESGGWQF